MHAMTVNGWHVQIRSMIENHVIKDLYTCNKKQIVSKILNAKNYPNMHASNQAMSSTEWQGLEMFTYKNLREAPVGYVIKTAIHGLT